MHEHDGYAPIHAKNATRGQHRCKNIKWDSAQSKFWKNFHKIEKPNPFSKKIPNFENLKLKSKKLKEKMKAMFRKTYLEVILQRFLLEIDGV